MPRKYSDTDVKRIAQAIPALIVEHAGNRTKTAKDLGLSRTQLDYLCSQYAPCSDALKDGLAELADAIEENMTRKALEGGHPTPGIFWLKSHRPEVYNPPQRVEDVTGYAKPGGDDKPKGDSAPASRFTLGVVNGGAPPGRDGTQG